MDMLVHEVMEDTTYIQDSIEVIWYLDRDKTFLITWDKKFLSLTKKHTKLTKLERKVIDKIQKRYSIKWSTAQYYKVCALYFNERNEVFYVIIYVQDCIMIWIGDIDKRFPCYFFKF
jgi:hypothetical protein